MSLELPILLVVESRKMESGEMTKELINVISKIYLTRKRCDTKDLSGMNLPRKVWYRIRLKMLCCAYVQVGINGFYVICL